MSAIILNATPAITFFSFLPLRLLKFKDTARKLPPLVSKVSEDQKETRVMLRKEKLEKEVLWESLGTRVTRVNEENVGNQE